MSDYAYKTVGPVYGKIETPVNIKAFIDSMAICEQIYEGYYDTPEKLEAAIAEWFQDWLEITDCLDSDTAIQELEGVLDTKVIIDSVDEDTMIMVIKHETIGTITLEEWV